MESLPDEIILIIFGYINKVTDKRQFSKTCKRYNILTKILLENIKKNLKLVNRCNDLQYFSAELCEDSYFDRIPLSYLNKNNIYIINLLAMYGQLELLKLAQDNGCEMGINVCTYATACGQLEVLKWLKDNNHIWDYDICENAALGGHLEVLKWAKENGCYLGSKKICYRAAQNGHLEVLKWARANDCHWDRWTCVNAAKKGHLEVLKWARANGCEWDIETRIRAEACGHHELLKWAIENGCP